MPFSFPPYTFTYLSKDSAGYKFIALNHLTNLAALALGSSGMLSGRPRQSMINPTTRHLLWLPSDAVAPAYIELPERMDAYFALSRQAKVSP